MILFLLFFRGVYLACFFYCEDKVLVTSEDQLPIVEVDETFAGPSINLDLYWLMKVSPAWCVENKFGLFIKQDSKLYTFW